MKFFHWKESDGVKLLVFILLFRTISGLEVLTTVQGLECNVTHVIQCYESMTYYEGLGFPFYGEDALELEETCRTMNESFECMEVYLDLCKGRHECDEHCQDMIEDIETFSENTGLRKVQKEICDPHSAMTEAYLENYSCLEKNINHYASCHNDSQMSQEYMTTIEDPHQAVAARCCFFTWYHDCFTNITRDSCNENATFFISFTIHNLIGHISLQLCGPDPEICERPPLPPSDEEENVIPIDDQYPAVTDVDNSLEEHHKSHGSSHVCSLGTLASIVFWILLSKYILKE